MLKFSLKKIINKLLRKIKNKFKIKKHKSMEREKVLEWDEVMAYFNSSLRSTVKTALFSNKTMINKNHNFFQKCNKNQYKIH